MERKKIAHNLDTPFSTVPWPEIPHDNQDTILELLCNLLQPLGEHRQKHVRPSKGKRARKRKRTEDPDGVVDKAQPAETPPPPPPVPEIAAYIDVGLASISRHLELLSAYQTPKPESTAETLTAAAPLDTYAAVFVARSDQSSAFHCHFPQMVAVASNSRKTNDSAIRLVGFSQRCSERLSTCLGVPRVSSIGIRTGAPNSAALVDFVRSHVPSIESSWVSQLRDSEYRLTKINSFETTIGPAKAKKNQERRG